MAGERERFARRPVADLRMSPVGEDWFPDEEDFIRQCEKPKGGAGFDGWSGCELSYLAKLFKFIVSELHGLWCFTATVFNWDPPAPEELAAIAHWRVAGIPKKDPSESRPIGVASVLLRARLSAVEKCLPAVSVAPFA